MKPTERPVKHDLFNSILAQNLTVHVDFDPWYLKVHVPPSRKPSGHQMRLDFDRVRCRDIKADPFGLEAGMTFGGAHWTVYIPWAAVFCIAFDVADGERGILYSEDMPQSVIDNMIRRSELDKQAEVIRKSEETAKPKQASLQGGAKIYDLAEARARKLAREQGGPRRPAG